MSDDESAAENVCEPVNNVQADALVASAKRKLARGMIRSWFSRDDKYESAVERYTRAAALYKMTKHWQLAGDAYMACARINVTGDAAARLEDAGKAFRHVDACQAVDCFSKAAMIRMENNGFGHAGRLWREVGELNCKRATQEAGDASNILLDAEKAFEQALLCFECENSSHAVVMGAPVSARIAALKADRRDFKAAIAQFETLARQMVDNSALRLGVLDYLFRALLCHLVLAAQQQRHDKFDLVRDSLCHYTDQLCPSLDGSREATLIQDFIVAFDDDTDPIRMINDLKNTYVCIKPLDDWCERRCLEFKAACTIMLSATASDDNVVAM